MALVSADVGGLRLVGGIVIFSSVGTMSFLGVAGAVEEEAVLCLPLDSLPLPFILPVRAVPEVPGALNMITLLAIGTEGSDLAGDHFLFNSSPCIGDVSLFLCFFGGKGTCSIQGGGAWRVPSWGLSSIQWRSKGFFRQDNF